MIPCGLVWFGQDVGVGPDGMSAGRGAGYLGNFTWIVSVGDSIHSLGLDMYLHSEAHDPAHGWTE